MDNELGSLSLGQEDAASPHLRFVFDAPACAMLAPPHQNGNRSIARRSPSIAGLLSLQSVALEHAVDGIFITDRGGAITWSNPAFGHLTGYARNEMIGRNPRFLKSGVHGRDFYRKLWSRILVGEVWSDSVVNVRKDGGVFRRAATVVPVRDSAGSISHFFSILQDDPRAKSIETTLRDSERRFRALTELEWQKAVEKERTRVARDMHDELGSSLTRIKVLAERLEQDFAQSEKALAHARNIARAAHAISENLDGIVWAVDPEKDRLEDLGTYLISHAQEFLNFAGLRFRLEIPEVLPDMAIRASKRHLVFCAFKEALNNIVKHASATEVHLRLAVRNRRLIVLVSDNGRGIDFTATKPGRSGLTNMQRRMLDAGGCCRIWGRPGKGTQVTLQLSLD